MRRHIVSLRHHPSLAHPRQERMASHPFLPRQLHCSCQFYPLPPSHAVCRGARRVAIGSHTRSRSTTHNVNADKTEGHPSVG